MATAYRQDKNGKRLEIVLSVSNDLSYGTTWVQTAELLIGYWDKVGVKVILNSMPDTQFIENKKQNKIEATMYTSEGGAGITAILDPRYYVPEEYFGLFGNGWFAWRIGSTDSVQVEPPQWAKDARAAYELVLVQPTQDLQISEMKKVIQTAMDNFYVIGIARPGLMYYPFSARLGGIPETWYDGWNEGVQKITYPEQWFINE